MRFFVRNAGTGDNDKVKYSGNTLWQRLLQDGLTIGGEGISFVLILRQNQKALRALLLGKNLGKMVEHRFHVKMILKKKLVLFVCAPQKWS